MIEVNLSSTHSSQDKLNLGGFDLSYLNIKMMFIGILFLYIPEGILSSYYDSEMEDLNLKEREIQKRVRAVSSKVRSLNNIKKQLDSLTKREKELAKKLKTVKVIINQRKNPFKILYYIAKNTPKTVWLTRLKMKDDALTLRGHAENWKDIGAFLESLKTSIFFNNLKYMVPSDANNSYDGRKVEIFEIKADIVRFK